MAEILLAVNDVDVWYGPFQAVRGASLKVESGEIVGLVGTNGAGKSSLFAAIAGQARVRGGHVMLASDDISRVPAHKRARLGLGRTFQVPREFGSMSVLENLLVAAHDKVLESMLVALWARSLMSRQEAPLRANAQVILDKIGLGDKATTQAASLSGGQKKLLELGRTLMLAPKLILLDEPFAGVNPVLIGEISRILEHLREEGVTLLIVEHHLQALARLADRLYVMDSGQVIAEGAPDTVLSSRVVQDAYMGG